jgi:hypothetical protein
MLEFRTQIEATDHKIDRLVYELDGHSDVEIKIVQKAATS